MTMWHEAWNIINNEALKGLKPAGLRAVAHLASWGYALGAAIDQNSFDFNLRKAVRVPVPVIGVGNITAGGAGKTPLTIKIVETLQAMGKQAVVISRGHGRGKGGDTTLVSRGQGPLLGARQCGDEPYMLAKRISAPIMVGANRVKLAHEAIALFGKDIIIVGDDLFQHRLLYRDLNIIALDAGKPLGNGFMLPRGPLREPATGIRRADAVVLTRADNENAVKQAKIWLRGYWGSGPVLASRHLITSLHNSVNQARISVSNARVLLFCGLANPASFVEGVKQMGLCVADVITFPDHHWFSEEELRQLNNKALELKADALLTTEKDLARLENNWPYSLPLWNSRLNMVFNDKDALTGLLGRALNDWKMS